MYRVVTKATGLAASLAMVGAAAPAAAQFVAAPGYAAAPTPQQVAPGAAFQTPAYQAAPVRVAAQPYTGQPYAAPQYGFPTPRVAQAGELPAPNEAVNAAASAVTNAVTPAPPAAPAAMPYNGGYETSIAPVASYPTAATTTYPSYTPQPMAASASCDTGACGVATPNYSPAASCDYGACGTAACDVAPAACGPRRQWFVGIYGLFLNRHDVGKRQVAYCTDTTGYTAGQTYYYAPGDSALFTSDADGDPSWGAEVRFGSTFGCDPCGCGQPFAWELGYWALDDITGSSVMTIDGPVGVGGTDHRLHGTVDYSGLMIDPDGAAGTTWPNREAYDYNDKGVPAEFDTNNVRLLGVRVRQRLQVQNLELNFWRFGTPAPAAGLGLGGGIGGGRLAGVASACGLGGGAGGAGACGDPCGAGCRPPRRFFLNGVAGVRYFRVDDDFGIDHQFTFIDAGTGNPPAGWPTDYESFPRDDNSTFYHEIDADNQLVGFQLGCSMNWLIGCKWNLFADTNFGVYGNQMNVDQRVFGGGASEITQVAGGGAAVYSASRSDVAFLGELRAGVGYQVSCNCRLTAAYRLISVSGVALGVDQIPTAGFATPGLVQHIDTDNLVLHGLQTGAEWKY
ncbi:MAG: hypothetical protein AAF805_12805 [Planctomycetota bacterium]